MSDGFKETLSKINWLTWATLSLAISLLILEPTTQNLTVLGFTVNTSRLLIVAPIALVGLLLARQIFIRNVIEIVRREKNRSELKEIALSYPIIEFMRWKFRTGLEVVLLTIFQVLVDVLPAISLKAFWCILENQNIVVPSSYKISNLLLLVLGIWNYASLRWQVYEPLAGKIETPD